MEVKEHMVKSPAAPTELILDELIACQPTLKPERTQPKSAEKPAQPPTYHTCMSESSKIRTVQLTTRLVINKNRCCFKPLNSGQCINTIIAN